VFLVTFLLIGPFAHAADGEADQFHAAAAAFTDRFYERAEQQLGDFLVKHPNSTNAPRALLMQAQARVFQKKFDPAMELLKKGITKSDGLKDQYTFWQGESLFQKGDMPGAVEFYRRVVTDFPASSLRLQAAFSEANAWFQLKDYPKTIDLLKNPEGEFQKLAKATPKSRFAFRGTLLLSEALFASSQPAEAQAIASAAVGVANRADLDWEKYQLLARIELAGQKPENALAHITNAVAAAQSAQKPAL